MLLLILGICGFGAVTLCGGVFTAVAADGGEYASGIWIISLLSLLIGGWLCFLCAPATPGLAQVGSITTGGLMSVLRLLTTLLLLLLAGASGCAACASACWAKQQRQNHRRAVDPAGDWLRRWRCRLVVWKGQALRPGQSIVGGCWDAVVASEGHADVVQISGGEPTLHPRLFDILDVARHRVTVSEIRRRIVEQSGLFSAQDVVPVPCNPDTLAMAYALRGNDGTLRPLTRFLDPRTLAEGAGNTIVFEHDAALKRRCSSSSRPTTRPNRRPAACRT